MKPDVSSDKSTICQMSEVYDVTPRSLRFYEAKELLAPERVGTRRLYSRTDRARLAELEAQRAELDLVIAALKAELTDAEVKGLVARRAA